jgi:S-adenosylmethionine synthetase
MARHVAKNIVAAGLADKAQVQVAYAIGVPEPVSIMVETYGTGKIPERKLEEVVRRQFDFRPRAIIEYLDLRRPVYRKTAAYGHFGRTEPGFTWEQTNRVKDLRSDAGV